MVHGCYMFTWPAAGNYALRWGEPQRHTVVVKCAAWNEMSLTSTTVASNKQSSKDQAAHNILFNMTVRPVQQIRRRPKWNPENKTLTAKATLARRSSYTGKHRRFQTACMQLKARPCVGTLIAIDTSLVPGLIFRVHYATDCFARLSVLALRTWKIRPGTRLNWYVHCVSFVFTLPTLLPPLCIQNKSLAQVSCTVAVAIVTLLACSCKLFYNVVSVPGLM